VSGKLFEKGFGVTVAFLTIAKETEDLSTPFLD
jgi:hypothetical protein